MLAVLQVQKIAEAQGYNQTRLQQETHLNKMIVNRYWRNKVRSVSFDVLEKIATVLNVAVSRLITDVTSADMEDSLNKLYSAMRKSQITTPNTRSNFAHGLSQILSSPDFNPLIQHELITRLSIEYVLRNEDTQGTVSRNTVRQALDEGTRELALLHEIRVLDEEARKNTIRQHG